MNSFSQEYHSSMPALTTGVETAGQQAKGDFRSLSALDKALLCAREGAEYKALEIVLLHVSVYSSFSDYFLICSGKSTRQVQGIADNIERALKDKGIRPLGVEGRTEGRWILMDYGEVIIHIFYEPVREFYDLESLWSEAKRVDWES